MVGDPAFPGSSSHARYSGRAQDNRKNKSGGWQLYSLTRERVQLSIGDVLVKPRGKPVSKSERAYNFSHGDIVWKIEDDTAYLAGGNLSDTMSNNIKISLDSDGVAQNIGKYLVVLKKDARIAEYPVT